MEAQKRELELYRKAFAKMEAAGKLTAEGFEELSRAIGDSAENLRALHEALKPQLPPWAKNIITAMNQQYKTRLQVYRIMWMQTSAITGIKLT